VHSGPKRRRVACSYILAANRPRHNPDRRTNFFAPRRASFSILRCILCNCVPDPSRIKDGVLIPSAFNNAREYRVQDHADQSRETSLLLFKSEKQNVFARQFVRTTNQVRKVIGRGMSDRVSDQAAAQLAKHMRDTNY